MGSKNSKSTAAAAVKAAQPVLELLPPTSLPQTQVMATKANDVAVEREAAKTSTNPGCNSCKLHCAGANTSCCHHHYFHMCHCSDFGGNCKQYLTSHCRAHDASNARRQVESCSHLGASTHKRKHKEENFQSNSLAANDTSSVNGKRDVGGYSVGTAKSADGPRSYQRKKTKTTGIMRHSRVHSAIQSESDCPQDNPAEGPAAVSNCKREVKGNTDLSATPACKADASPSSISNNAQTNDQHATMCFNSESSDSESSESESSASESSDSE